MKWILFLITVMPNEDRLDRLGKYDTMYQCFEEWEAVNNELTIDQSRSKLDVQIVCLQTTEK